MAGPELVLALARRRIWHQFIAVAAMLGAAGWRWRCTRASRCREAQQLGAAARLRGAADRSEMPERQGAVSGALQRKLS